MRSEGRVVIVLGWLLVACDAPAVIDPACTIADVECPAEPPFSGAPCEGALACDYTTATGPGHFACEAGRWSGAIECTGCAPVLAETCREPVASSAATVQLGPGSGAFHPFASGEMVPLEWGPQGLAMVPFRVRVGGDAPSCARVTSRIALGDGSPLETTRGLTLRCGESLGILEILPDLPCTPRPYAVHLEVDVEGAGSATAELVIEGGGCTFMMP